MATRKKRLPDSKRSAPLSFKESGNLKNYYGKSKEKTKVYFVKTSKTVEKRPFLSFFIGLGILLAIILLGNTIFRTTSSTEKEEQAPKDVTVFRIGEAPKMSVQGEVKKNGVIKISAQTPGIVSTINVVEGTSVAKGKVIISLSSNYQGGNAAVVQKQLAGVAYINAKETSEIQKELIQKQRDLANEQSNNSEELRKITEASISETESLLNLNNDLLNQVKNQIEDLQANNGDPAQIALLQAQQSQLQAVVNQQQAALRAAKYQVDTNSPANDITKISKEITLKQLDLQEKAIAFSLQTSALQVKLAQIQAAMMFPAAPFPGTVERIHVKVGESVTPGDILATLTGDEGSIIIDAKVSQDIAQKVTTTEEAVILVGTKQIKVVPFYVSSEATSGQLYSVLFSLDKSFSPNFTDQAYVSVSLPVGNSETGSTVPFIPVDSVFQTQNEAYVYIVEEDKAKSKQVKLGPVTGKYVVVEQGLTGSEQIILSRTVIDGDIINVTN